MKKENDGGWGGELQGGRKQREWGERNKNKDVEEGCDGEEIAEDREESERKGWKIETGINLTNLQKTQEG